MKTAIITGGGSGIGAAVARALAREGFRVGLIGRRGARVEAVASGIERSGGDSWWAAVDVRDVAAVAAFVESAIQRYGQIDLLVNSAGVFDLGATHGTSSNRTVRTTLRSCSTSLCFRLCSSACGTVSGSATG